MTIMECGVAEHPSECLCDVNLEAYRLRYPHLVDAWCTSIDDIWMGREICSLLGMELPLDEAQLVQLLEAIGYATDRWDPSLLDADPNEALTINDPTIGIATKWGRIRHEVRRLLSKRPQPMLVDVLAVLGITSDEFVGACTNYNKSITLDQLLVMEEAVRSQSCHNGYELQRLCGLESFKTADNMHKYWGIPYRERSSLYGATPISVRTKELILSGVPDREVCAMIESEFGVLIKQVSVYKTKLRMRKKGLL